MTKPLGESPCCNRGPGEMHLPGCPVAARAVAKAEAERDERVRARTVAAFAALGPGALASAPGVSALDVQVAGSHYKDLKIQPVEYIHANGIPFIEGSVIKYVTRWRAKGGVKDLEKARHFLDLLIEMEGKALAK